MIDLYTSVFSIVLNNVISQIPSDFGLIGLRFWLFPHLGGVRGPGFKVR
jgi:hypothetical protein